MSKKRRRAPDEDATVEMSSLIDCVFLLLIFFLVTTMMKKLEKQIPVVVPDNSVAVSQRADNQRQILGINEDGSYFYSTGRLADGRPKFVRLSDLDAHINLLASRKDDVNVRLYADANVEFQKVIDVLDKLQMKGLDKVDVRMRDLRGDNWYVPGSQEKEERLKKMRLNKGRTSEKTGDSK